MSRAECRCTRYDFIDLGLLDYSAFCGYQRDILSRRISGNIQDTVLLAEHHPVITSGRMTSKTAVKSTSKEISGISLVPVDRGGGMTYHGPGQLMVYPVISLDPFGRDILRYLSFLEEFLLDFFSQAGCEVHKIHGKRGAWVNKRKIASLGIGIRRWVAYHGMGLNINPDLAPFGAFEVCNDRDTVMTSLKDEGISMDMGRARSLAQISFMRVSEKYSV